MKVEFSAFPKAFSGNVAVFVGADKQLLATAQVADAKAGGALTRALEAGRFTGAKNQTLTILGHSGDIARLMLLGAGKGRELDARPPEALGGLVPAPPNPAGPKPGTWVGGPVGATAGLRIGDLRCRQELLGGAYEHRNVARKSLRKG